MKSAAALPTTFPAVLVPGQRERLEEVIEALITALDLMDEDPDLEPSLGWTGYGGGVGRNDTTTDDCEIQDN